MSGLGRKRSMFYLQIPLFIGWVLPFFAETVWELYIAASIMGIGIGFMQAPIATYIGEVTLPQYRGLLACIAYCFLTLGSVCVYAIDVIVGNWRHTALYCAVMPPLTAVILYIIPESPIWLVSQGRYADAKKALAWLRGWVSESEIEPEFKTILVHNSPKFAALVDNEIPTVSGDFDMDTKDPVKSETYKEIKYEQQSNTAQTDVDTGLEVSKPETEKEKEPNWSGNNKNEEPFIRFLARPEMYRPLLLSAVYLYLSNGIGVAVFRPYLVLIFRDFRIEFIDEYIATIAVTTIGLVGNIASVVLMSLIGKRRLTIIAIILCAIGCFGIGIYKVIDDHQPIPPNMTWLAIAFMIAIFFSTNLAVGHMPWVLMSEIFPLRGRTLATGVVAGFGNFLQFLGTKLFITYVDKMLLSGTFFMYGGTFLVGLIYLYFFMFETEGRSLDEIVALFRGEK
ncbi:facilitated trehalose transporter Tret1 isoform X2 [Halyomorpha halys]